MVSDQAACAGQPFWSPDGDSIAFFYDDTRSSSDPDGVGGLGTVDLLTTQTEKVGLADNVFKAVSSEPVGGQDTFFWAPGDVLDIALPDNLGAGGTAALTRLATVSLPGGSVQVAQNSVAAVGEIIGVAPSDGDVIEALPGHLFVVLDPDGSVATTIQVPGTDYAEQWVPGSLQPQSQFDQDWNAK
jgi:hypothetical protein